MKSHSDNKITVESVENTYGYTGLISIFNELDIDITNWVSQQTTKERGGIEFTLPNSQGEIYLNWGDLYVIDVKFIHSKKRYTETLNLYETKEIIKSLEQQRQRHIDDIKDMLKDMFSGKDNK
jgi:hypothetical protein